MMFKLTAAAAVPVLFFTLTIALSAKPEFSKKEKKGCVACHTANGSKQLNDAGKFYKENGKLPAAK